MKSKKESTTVRKELVRQELLTKAAEVFERQGFAQTTILDVAKAMQLSRSALYHYFKSKDEILDALVEELAGSIAEERIQVRLKSAHSPLEKLRQLLAGNILGRMTGGARFRVLEHLTAEMPPAIRQKFDKGRRSVLDLFVSLIREGIEAGEIRQVDPKTAALAIIGIAAWTSWWYSPSGKQSPDELANLLIDIAFHGLVETEKEPTERRASQTILRSIKRNLQELERSIEAESDARS